MDGSDKTWSATLSIASAADYLDVPIETLRWWLKQGRFKRVKIGRRVLIRRADLNRYIEEHADD